MTQISLPEKKKNRKMEIILSDALHYFEKNGYDNTTIDQLCEAAMISSSTFFNYFGTKEKLVELIMMDGLEDFRETYEKVASDGGDPFDAAEKGLLSLCDTIEKYCSTVSVFHRIALQRDDFREIELEHTRIGADMIKLAFEKSSRPCPVSDDALMDMIGGCFTHPFLVLPPAEASARARGSVRELIDIMRGIYARF